jgi:CRISPR-associated exonuclease Cas4
MTNPFQWEKATAFYERIERFGLHGLHFQHVALCVRRAWFYLHNINFAQWNERVARGAALHNTTYARDRSTVGLFGLAPDRIDWEKRIVYESKGTAGALEAVSDQTAFYAVMLSIASGFCWKAATHIVSSRRRREVVIDVARLDRLWRAAERLEALTLQATVPDAQRQRLCASCSFAKLCGFD